MVMRKRKDLAWVQWCGARRGTVEHSQLGGMTRTPWVSRADEKSTARGRSGAKRGRWRPLEPAHPRCDIHISQ